MIENTNKKLKPVVFVQGRYDWNSQNTTQQMLLLKALRITQDPEKLRDMIGVKSVTDVYRTLDKIAMRKEYHAALAKAGLSFDYIVTKVKSEIENAHKSSDRLAGLNMLLKSVGLDKYEETATHSGSWEEVLLKLAEEKEKQNSIENPLKIAEYKVIEPVMPEELRLAKEKSNKETKGLYD